MFWSTPSSIFDPPSPLEVALSSPLNFITRLAHRLLTTLRSPPSPPPTHPITIVTLSDTHNLTPATIPPGDLLIHAGDLTQGGSIPELQAQLDWLASLPHRHKVIIAGNHDTYLDPRSRQTLSEAEKEGELEWHGMHYLQHSSVSLSFPSPSASASSSHGSNGSSGIRTLKIYGAPQIPACGGLEFAFQYPRGQDAWSETIPADTDVLVTHTPPKYHLDLPAALGCEHLLRETWRVKPRLHVFGHVHAGRGREEVWWNSGQRAYERVMGRKGGLVVDFFDVLGWVDLVRVVVYGVKGVVWDRVWGGEAKSGILVNAALMYNNTGRLGNEPQVVRI